MFHFGILKTDEETLTTQFLYVELNKNKSFRIEATLRQAKVSKRSPNLDIAHGDL